ncbi:MAG TPA: SPW repeat protein [Xanthobacteraceae bacterium]|nr:SPW repeat protein [Xanthobacteraceae bacterium]
MANALKRETWPDVVNLILGACLFLSPWVLGFYGDSAASWNAWLSGIVVAGLAIAALAAFAEWEEWINLIVGIWVAVSPWLVGFSGDAAAAWTHLILGAIVAIVAAARIWLARSPHVTA